MKNPYWHDEFKPHLADRSEIRRLCFEVHNIVLASMSLQGEGVDLDENDEPEFSSLHQLCFNLAEAELSRRLLRLALLVRTFDDTVARSEQADEYIIYRKAVEDDIGGFGAVFGGPSNATDTLRACCNKIIHAEDVRPTYETGDDRDDPRAMWGMDGQLELEGVQAGAHWEIVIYIFPFLEGIVDLVKFGEK